jgi:hypothetical protein
LGNYGESTALEDQYPKNGNKTREEGVNNCKAENGIYGIDLSSGYNP